MEANDVLMKQHVIVHQPFATVHHVYMVLVLGPTHVNAIVAMALQQQGVDQVISFLFLARFFS